MPKKPPQSLDRLLNHSQFRQLSRHSQVLRTFQRHFSACCDQYGLKQCRVANFRNGVLVIEVGSAAWRQRMNQLRTVVLSELRKEVPQLVALEIVQNPGLLSGPARQGAAGANTAPSRRLSRRAAEHLEALAKTAPPGLQDKLRKLAALAGEK